MGETGANVATSRQSRQAGSYPLVASRVLNRRREAGYRNENGNDAISEDVLKEFRKLTEHTAIWERGERMWRTRRDKDKAGRAQE